MIMFLRPTITAFFFLLMALSATRFSLAEDTKPANTPDEFLNRFFSIGLINLLGVVFVMTSQTEGIRDDSAKKRPFHGITLFDVTHYSYAVNR